MLDIDLEHAGPDAVERLATRVSRLERDNRVWKVTACASLIAAGLMIGVLSGSSRVLEAEQFALRDTRGVPRGALAVDRDGSVSLRFVDGEGRTRVLLGVFSNDNVGLSLAARGEPETVKLLVTADGASGLAFGKDGLRRAALGLTRKGSPVLDLADRHVTPAVAR